MARIAVTDGMSAEAVEMLENAGHEVVLRHHDPEEISSGSLKEFDAVVIRSATKLNAERSEERRVGKECRSRWSPYH